MADPDRYKPVRLYDCNGATCVAPVGISLADGVYFMDVNSYDLDESGVKYDYGMAEIVLRPSKEADILRDFLKHYVQDKLWP